MKRIPLNTVEHVELPRFMGDWYVIASIPTLLERGAHNAVESYTLAADGTIATTYRFHRGGFHGPLKRFTARGFVQDHRSNAIWGMQFVWPVRADYRVTWLDADYSLTVIGREKRDYVWVMARRPAVPEARYAELLAYIASQGYDVAAIRPVPQRWAHPAAVWPVEESPGAP